MEQILKSSDLINSFSTLFSYIEMLTLQSWKFAVAKQNHLHQHIWAKTTKQKKPPSLSLPHANLVYLLRFMQGSMLETVCVCIRGITEVNWIHFAEFLKTLNKSAFHLLHYASVALYISQPKSFRSLLTICIKNANSFTMANSPMQSGTCQLYFLTSPCLASYYVPATKAFFLSFPWTSQDTSLCL